MSAYTDGWLTMFEMELAGLFERVELIDGTEDWEPRMDISRDEFEARMDVFFLGKRWGEDYAPPDGALDDG